MHPQQHPQPAATTIFASLIAIFFLNMPTIFGQTTLKLLNGDDIKLETYVFHGREDGYCEFSVLKKSGKLKTHYADADDIYAININGVDSIVYQPLTPDEFTQEEMHRVILGRQAAKSEYNPWWAYAAGAAVSCGTMFLNIDPNYKLLIPLTYMGGMAFVRPPKGRVKSRHPDKVDDSLYIYGYQNSGRRKQFKNTVIGTVGGIFLSGIIWGTIKLTAKKQS